MIRELQWAFDQQLADSLYGESGCGFINVLYELKLDFVVAIRSNHAVWLPRANGSLQSMASLSACSAMETELRYIREIIFGKRRTQQYWELTTDPETLPKNATV